MATDDVDEIKSTVMNLMEIADRLPKQFAGTLRDIIDDLSDLVDDIEEQQ